jgi:hypothetical protein
MSSLRSWESLRSLVNSLSSCTERGVLWLCWRSPLVPIRSQTNQFHILTTRSFEIQRNLYYSQKPQEALNLLVTEERYWALFYMPLYTFIHNLLNVLVQIANKMGFKKKLIFPSLQFPPDRFPTKILNVCIISLVSRNFHPISSVLICTL